MRLKSYTAPTMAEAMEMVREELGDDAIIVSTQRASGGKGVRVSAALEEIALDEELVEVLTGHAPSANVETIREALADHGTPSQLIDQIVSSAREQDQPDQIQACAAAFEGGFTFAPIPERKIPRPIMLIGPPGVGKTVTTAKLVARAVLSHRSVFVIQADAVRAGSLEQLQAFTRILETDVTKANGPSALAKVLRDIKDEPDLTFIDSPGLNPFNSHDMDYLRRLIQAGDIEPILVLSAGGDPFEAAEMARIFAEAGATRLLATRLDMTRRLGSILAAAAATNLAFCDVTIAPHVANGLCPLSSVSLARLILRSEESTEQALANNFEFPSNEFTQTKAVI